MRLRNGKTYSRYTPYKKKYKTNIVDSNDQIQCIGCNRIWDGNAQCSCWLIGMYQ